MGRNSDKLYITSSEWAVEGGGAKAKARGSEFKKLPFTHCALSLQPFTHPVATDQGHIFELLNIMPWIKKHGNNPVTGAELDASQL